MYVLSTSCEMALVLMPKNTLDDNSSLVLVTHFGVTRPQWVTIWIRLLFFSAWWRHQMETFSALLAICAGNSPVPGEFPAQRPVTRSFDVFFDLRLNKRLSKQSWGWWFETLSRPLWRHCNDTCWPKFTTTRTNQTDAFYMLWYV